MREEGMGWDDNGGTKRQELPCGKGEQSILAKDLIVPPVLETFDYTLGATILFVAFGCAFDCIFW